MFANTRISRLLWFGLLGLVVICFMALIFEAIWIERELNQKVSNRIEEAGFQRVKAEARGRDIHLRGLVSSDQAIVRVVKLAGSVSGVRRVEPKIKIGVYRMPHLRIIVEENGQLRFTGELPDEIYVQQLIDSLGTDRIAAAGLQISIEPETSEPEWIGAVAEFLAIGRN
ncbi:MAG: BON domain-containing protein, partial [bacterium]